YQLLQNGCIVMYWRANLLAQDIEWLKEHEYRINSFDCRSWENEKVMFADFSTRLEFPEGFGRNLDSLNDCLCDIEVPKSGGRVLVFQRYDLAVAKLPAVTSEVLDILADNCRLHLLFGRRLIVLLQTDDPRLQFRPVGALPVLWNRKEMSSQARGL